MKPTILSSLLLIPSLLLNAARLTAQTIPPSVRTPVADTTLGTQVGGGGNQFIITGGLNRGQTLFHSFTDFSIPTGGSANFVNPTGNRDIISRVTGRLFSDIDGTLNSGGANFLLINPNGIVFGPNTQLNVGKAFAASTANGVDLLDPQGKRYTFGTNGAGDAPLLTINPNVLFNISRLNMGANLAGNPGIVNYGTLQTNNDSQYIGLIGGNVTLDGKYGGGKIVAPGGRVDLGGLNSSGTISLDKDGLTFGGNNLTRGDVLLTTGASVNVRANQTLGSVNVFSSDVAALGSSVNIGANNLNIINAGDNISKYGVRAISTGLETDSGVKTTATGDVNINATGQVNIDNSIVNNTIRDGAAGKIGNIKINANSLNLTNGASISSATFGKGNAGNIDIKTTGDIRLSGAARKPDFTNQSAITSSTYGEGNAGNITIDTQNRGKLSLNEGSISSSVAGDVVIKDDQPVFLSRAVGNGGDITIFAKEIDLRNSSDISSTNMGKGNAGNINIKTTGDISISGSTPESAAQTLDLSKPISINNLPQSSSIQSNTSWQGNAGSISIDTQNKGKVLLSNRGIISSSVSTDAEGNGGNLTIFATKIDLKNRSSIASLSLGIKGNAGDINIRTTGDIRATDLSSISSFNTGKGDAGKITIDTQNQGKFLLSDSSINNLINKNAEGNSRGITILAKEIEMNDGSLISSDNFGGKGNAGDINIKTTGDIRVAKKSFITSDTDGQGNAGKITIDTQNKGKLLLDDATIFNTIGKDAVGNGQDITISAQGVNLANTSFIASRNFGGTGNTGNINIRTTGAVELSQLSAISSDNLGQGQTGNIAINSDKINLNNGFLGATSKSGSGGNIQLTTRDKLLLRNISGILTISDSQGKNGNGGNINITSPLIIAAPGDNDIVANAFAGTGGNVNITSDGLFGIRYRPQGQESNFTSDITSSSRFGQSGTVDIKTPGTDPGRDASILPTVPQDASNQFSHVCSEQYRQNKFYVTGRGGIPPNADEPLTPDIVWQDTRGAKGQPVASGAINNREELPPPAVGWVFDGKGRVRLISARDVGQLTGTRVVCPTKVVGR